MYIVMLGLVIKFILCFKFFLSLTLITYKVKIGYLYLKLVLGQRIGLMSPNKITIFIFLYISFFLFL